MASASFCDRACRSGSVTGSVLAACGWVCTAALPHEAVVAGVNAVLQAGSVSPDLVAIEARKAVAVGGPPPVVITPPSNATTAEDEPEDQDIVSARVISLPARRPELPPDT